MFNHLFRATTCVSLGLALLVAAGCGPTTASVSGVVKLRGQALSSGTVLFHGPDGRVEHSLIGVDGRYTIANAPLNSVRITVQSHAASPSGLPTRGDRAPATAPPTGVSPKPGRDGPGVVLNKRYLDPDRSGLSFTVRPGPQTFDIDLEP